MMAIQEMKIEVKPDIKELEQFLARTQKVLDELKEVLRDYQFDISVWSKR
jgi:hypothetical protein